jgi:hypothetical protein
MPNIAQDVDGKYRGRDNKVHEGDGLIIILSLIILSCGTSIVYLIEKKRTADFINTFLSNNTNKAGIACLGISIQ